MVARRFAYDDEAVTLSTDSTCDVAGRVPSNRRETSARVADTIPMVARRFAYDDETDDLYYEFLSYTSLD